MVQRALWGVARVVASLGVQCGGVASLVLVFLRCRRKERGWGRCVLLVSEVCSDLFLCVCFGSDCRRRWMAICMSVVDLMRCCY